MGVVFAMVIAMLPLTLPAAAVNGLPSAYDMVGSASQNLTSYVATDTSTWGSGDSFAKFTRPDSGIPYAVADDSLVSYPADTAGVIDDNNLDEFFGVCDTENSFNTGPVVATWVFDVSTLPDSLQLSIDMGAMGDFEAADSFVFTYSFDGGATETAFTSSVDEDGSLLYTLASGTETTFDDPMAMNGTTLTNVLQTLTTPLTGTGDALTLTLTTTTDGGSEGFAIQSIVIDEYVPPFVSAYDMVGSASQNLTSYVATDTSTWGSGDSFAKFTRPDSGIPYAVADDSLVSYPADTAGVIDDNNLDEFFGVCDTENSFNTGPVVATWVFDIRGGTDLALSIDMGAMGDFELADSFVFTYSIDGGSTETAFTSSVDEDGSLLYTLASGTETTFDDPMAMNGTTLTNVLQTLKTDITGTGDALTLTLTTTTDGGSEGFALQDILIDETGGVVLPPAAYLSEIHYDNDGADAGEFVEVTGDAGTDLTGWTVELYNGSNGELYDTVTLSGTIDDEAGSMGAMSFDRAGIQNGGPDGFALIDNLGAVTEFLSYEGSFAATTGTASGMTSTDIGVSELSSTPVGESLQLIGDTWKGPRAASPGDLNAPVVYLSEIHYDNDGTDVGEFVEVTGDAGTDLTGWTVELYNGNGGALYDTVALSGTIDDEAGAMGALSFDRAGIQNGSPDGFALIDGGGALVEFLSYEGSFAAIDGTAVGVTSTDIGVSEPSTTPIGESLQLFGGIWAGPATASPGDLNTEIAVPIVCGEAATFIHDVQGNGAASPLDNTVVEIEGIVVGDFQQYTGNPADAPLGGFMVQEEDADADADAATSEGVFVYDPAGTDVAVGDLVRVKGTVDEYYGLTEIISVTQVVVCSSANPLPTPAAVTLPTSLGDPVADWEAVEGMGVVIAQPLWVTELYRLGSFGEVKLSAIGVQDQPNQVAPVGSQTATDIRTLNQNSRITLDDGEDENEYDSGSWNPATTPYLSPADGTLRSGDTIAGLAGVVHYSFSEYEIQPVNVVDPTAPAALLTFVRANARPALPDVGGTFKVASFNVLNYFTTYGDRGADNEAEFLRQAAKIVEAIIAVDADVVGLMEIENNGTAIADLVTRLNAAPGATRTYGYIDTGVVGADAIAQGIIYDTATALPVGGFAVLDDSVSPAFLEAKNRPAVTQTFQEIGSTGMVTIAVNHLKSKGSSCDGLANPGDPTYGVLPYATDPDNGVFAGNCNLTRTAAAQVLGGWLASDPTGTGAPYSLIIGDLNAYAMEDPITALEALGYTNLHNVYSMGAGWQMGGHTYVYDGENGSLDYAMAGAATLPVVTGAAAWHINADEPPALDYNDYNPAANYTADEYRASDHDPVIVGLAMTPRAIKESTASDLAILIGLGTTPDDRRIKRAIRDINRSLIESRWTSDSTLDDHSGVIVFWRERRAVRRLLNLSPAVSADGLNAVKNLVAADRELARVAIDIVKAKAGPIDRAERWFARGDEAAAVENWIWAVQCYMMAWVNATL